MVANQNPTVFSRIVEYPLPKGGINLFDSMIGLKADEAIKTQNLFFNGGLSKREGTFKYSSTALSGGTTVLGLFRYYTSAAEYILAASGAKIEYGSGGTWTTLTSAFTGATRMTFETWFNGSCYVANGTDTPGKITGTTFAAYTTAGTAKQFLSYQDRLLAIVGGDLTWSGAFDDTTWGTVANIGVRPDSVLYGMCRHSEASATSGLLNKVLLAGENGMYLFSGTDLRWPSTTGNYKVDKICSVGCRSPQTMCWTPKGTFWLGMDNQVYMLPFSSTTYEVVNVIPAGTHITSNKLDEHGLEGLPSSRLTSAVAVYNDGMYKLTVTPYGGTKNTVSYWLDTTRMMKDEHGHIAPWYGPMIYPYDATAFCPGIGNVSHSLMMGGTIEGTPDTAYVFECDDDSVHADNGSSYECIWETSFSALADTMGYMKNINKAEFDLVIYGDAGTLDFKDINGTLRSSVALSLPTALVYWGQQNWGAFYWNGGVIGRTMLPLSPTLQARTLSMLVKNTSTSNFRIYGARVEAEEQSLSFPVI